MGSASAKLRRPAARIRTSARSSVCSPGAPTARTTCPADPPTITLVARSRLTWPPSHALPHATSRAEADAVVALDKADMASRVGGDRLPLMSNAAALLLDGVGVVRDGTSLLADVTWSVGPDDRWVVLGPNGAGKTTLLRVASANLFPTSGTVTILGERLGAVDVFELRPRIGLSSAALAERIPAKERVRDVVLTASYAVVGRWREDYAGADETRAEARARPGRLRSPDGPPVRHAVGGGAQADPDRSRADDRPRAAAARRARCGAGPGGPRGPRRSDSRRWPPTRWRRRWCW